MRAIDQRHWEFDLPNGTVLHIFDEYAANWLASLQTKAAMWDQTLPTQDVEEPYLDPARITRKTKGE